MDVDSDKDEVRAYVDRVCPDIHLAETLLRLTGRGILCIFPVEADPNRPGTVELDDGARVEL